MKKPSQKTDTYDERAKGRVALWLEPTDLEYLSKHCCCPEGADAAQTERCGRIRFRANAALQKAGLRDVDD